MRFFVQLLFFGTVALGVMAADQVNYTYVESATTPVSFCFYGCAPLDFTFPQLDPNLGTIAAVTWTFTAGETYYGGFNDEGAAPGESFTYTTTEGYQSALLGLNASDTQDILGTTCGCRQISLGGFWNSAAVSASGTAPDSSPFSGTGTVDVTVQPFLDASFPVVDGPDSVYAALISEGSSATLTLTYEDTTVPEPHAWWYCFLLGAGIVWLRERRRRDDGYQEEAAQGGG